MCINFIIIKFIGASLFALSKKFWIYYNVDAFQFFNDFSEIEFLFKKLYCRQKL